MNVLFLARYALYLFIYLFFWSVIIFEAVKMLLFSTLVSYSIEK